MKYRTVAKVFWHPARRTIRQKFSHSFLGMKFYAGERQGVIESPKKETDTLFSPE
jgi:hypothetical protein